MITYRKILNKNLNSGQVVIYPKDMVDYYSGALKALILLREDNSEIEQYYGYGLQKLIESAYRYKEKEWLLAVRHLKANTW
jgi:hypothetical protein